MTTETVQTTVPSWRFKVPPKLTLTQRLKLLLLSRAYLMHLKRPGWRKPLPIYIVKCKRHGLYLDYPHGFRGYFVCPRCWEEEASQKRGESTHANH